MSPPVVIPAGTVFERLTVNERAGRNNDGKILYRCTCVCGNEVVVASYKLRSGHTRSCGCLQRERAVENGRATIRHGHCVNRTMTGTYKSWKGMWDRCTNVNHIGFEHYGGRGISVCRRWRLFENFLADMGDRPTGMSLDRIDNEGDYEPGNCRWATWNQQAANRRKARDRLGRLRRARIIVAASRGESQRVVAARYGVDQTTVSHIMKARAKRHA